MATSAEPQQKQSAQEPSYSEEPENEEEMEAFVEIETALLNDDDSEISELFLRDVGKQSRESEQEHVYKQHPELPTIYPDAAAIEQEEEGVEAIASMIIADAAAAAAAKAEALAESFSARTREAQWQAVLADNALNEVCEAIRNGRLYGEEAEHALTEAEEWATRAHALLADLEVKEENARRIAMNAEAEAEVAEGMAYAANEREAVGQDREKDASVEHIVDISNAEIGDEDDETTLEIPAIHPHTFDEDG